MDMGWFDSIALLIVDGLILIEQTKILAAIESFTGDKIGYWLQFASISQFIYFDRTASNVDSFYESIG